MDFLVKKTKKIIRLTYMLKILYNKTFYKWIKKK